MLPTIAAPGNKASGVVISCSGMKGSDIRGQNYARADGQVVRPQLVMVDDPQTTESAWSPSQSQRREAILAGDVLGMAGPGRKIAGLMACTVIRPGDMADNILDRDKHPEWQGERTKMVYAFDAYACAGAAVSFSAMTRIALSRSSLSGCRRWPSPTRELPTGCRRRGSIWRLPVAGSAGRD